MGTAPNSERCKQWEAKASKEGEPATPDAKSTTLKEEGEGGAEVEEEEEEEEEAVDDQVAPTSMHERSALKVPLSLACRRDERSAATLAFIDLVRRLPS